jgi:hypothetical protein
MTPLPIMRWVFLLGLSLLCGCSSYRILGPGKTELGSGRIAVPAQIIGSHFVVETKWDKHGPWRFLVDTGSSVTIVSTDFANRYRTKDQPVALSSVRVRSADGSVAVLPALTVRRIGLNEAAFENVEVLVKDLADVSAHLGVRIDGILGFPLFRNTVFSLDYPRSQLVLLPPNEAQNLPGSTIKFNNSRRTPLIPVQIGSTTLVALIDSGSDGPLLLNPFGLNLTYATTPRPGGTIGTLVGNRTQEIGRLADALTIGSHVIEQPIVDLTDQLSSLGAEVLRNFTVTFDQSRNQVTFHRDDVSPIRMPPRRSTGLAFSKGPTYWRVVSVVPGSPADQAGVQPGDLVTRVNGESIANWPLARFEPFVRRNAEIVFTFLDGAREKPVVIPTFELVP